MVHPATEALGRDFMRSTICIRSFGALLLSFAAACAPGVTASDDTGGDDMGGDDEGPRPDAGPVSTQRCQKMDLVFVVDNSGSMAEEQTNLATNFPQFATLLNAYMVDGDLPLDYRVAITTTGRDVDYVTVIPAIPPLLPEQQIPLSEEGDDGVFRQTCSMPRKWLERTDPNMEQTFACAANVGTGGPGMEMPLHASELALDDRVADGTNAGFLREDALLAIVYLTDEDDCSRHDNNFTVYADQPCTTEPPSQWVQFFDELKGDRGRWATAVIAGPTNCTSEFGDAVAANRMMEFVNLTGENAVFSSICDGNLAPALQQALDTFTAACETFPDVD
jgi:hypothetical protein